MKGVSPIVSTILMVAIAIAAAVVVYYITMDVITKQGAQLQEQSQINTANIVIQGANIEVNGSSFGDADASDKLKIYYSIYNSTVTNVNDLGNPVVYIMDTNKNTVCSLSGTDIKTDTSGVIELNTSKNISNCNVVADNDYYLQISTTKAISNLYKVKAKAA